MSVFRSCDVVPILAPVPARRFSLNYKHFNLCDLQTQFRLHTITREHASALQLLIHVLMSDAANRLAAPGPSVAAPRNIDVDLACLC